MTFFYDLNKRLASLATKQDAKQISEDAKATAPKSKLAESMGIAERDYSAKKAAAGKDIGKPGKNFGKIVADAGKRYGSKAAGERVAGAVLNKLRHPKESTGMTDEGNAFTGALAKTPKGGKFKVGGKEFTDTSSLEEGTCPTCDCSPCKCESMDESAFQAAIGKKKYGDQGMKALQKAGREHASAKTMSAIRNRYDKYDESQGMTDEGNAFTGALASTPKGGKFKVGGKEFTDTSSLEEGHCPACDCAPCKCNEGNAFSGAVAKAKADGIQKGETIKVGGKTYPVKEADQVGLAEKKKEPRSKGTAFDKEHMDKLQKEKEAETHSRYDVKDTGYSKRYTRKAVDTDIDKDDEVKSDEPKKKGRPKGPAKGPERTTKGAWKHKGDRKVKEDGMPITDRGEYDDEAGMAKDSLHTIVRHAKELENALRSNENMPEWVQEKIGQIKGMMSSVTDYILSTHERDVEQHTGKEGITLVPEKAVSQAQRKFMGMAHAIQKGEKIKGASPELKKVAKSMKPVDTHDFAATKEKGLPEKVKAKKKESKEEVEETTTSGSVAPAENAAPKSSKGMQFGKGVYESINREVETLLEGMNISVNMNTDENGEPHKSITVSADGAEADVLAQLLKAAGIDHQGSESCSTCGATPCGCDQQVDENSPDWPTNTETLAADPNLRTYSGGLNGPKSTGQTTVPVVASQLRRQSTMEENVELERSLFKTWKNYKG